MVCCTFLYFSVLFCIPGQLAAIVGRVGSGKSSLLNALLGELNLEKGSVTLLGSLAYHQQQPWIVNSSVEENILFGLPKDEQRFQAVLAHSALEDDIKNFPAGLKTEIGEKGTTERAREKRDPKMMLLMQDFCAFGLLSFCLFSLSLSLSQFSSEKSMLRKHIDKKHL